MNYELIKKMQKNWTALGGLSREELQCLKDNLDNVLINSGIKWNVPISSFDEYRDSSILRIDPSWTPWEDAPEGYRLVTKEEQKKYNKPSDYKYKCENLSWRQSSDCRKDDWQPKVIYAVPKNHVWDEEITSEYLHGIDIQKVIYHLSKPELKNGGRWVEYDVKPLNGRYMVLFNSSKCGLKPMGHLDKVGLRKVTDMIGFGGVQFDGQMDDEWHMDIAVAIRQDGSIFCDMLADECRPAAPSKAKFWVEA